MKKPVIVALTAIAAIGTARAELLVYFDMNASGQNQAPVGATTAGRVNYFPTEENVFSPNFGDPGNQLSFIGGNGGGNIGRSGTSGEAVGTPFVDPTYSINSPDGKAGTFVDFTPNNNQLLATFSTYGFEDVNLRFDYLSSALTGPTSLLLSYRVNTTSGGTSLLLTPPLTRGSYQPYTIALSDLIATQNTLLTPKPSVDGQNFVQLLFSFQGQSSAGTLSMDNFLVTGNAIPLTPIPEPVDFALPLFGLLVGMTWVIRRRSSAARSARTLAA